MPSSVESLELNGEIDANISFEQLDEDESSAYKDVLLLTIYVLEVSGLSKTLQR